MSNLLNISRKAEKLEKVRVYLSVPYKDRLPLPVFRRETGIRRNEFIELKRDVEAYNKDLAMANFRTIQENLMGDTRASDGEVVDDDVNVDTFLQDHWGEFLQFVFKLSKDNAQSQRLYAQLAGKLIEKSEVKVGLTGDETAQRNREAAEELTQFRITMGQRVDKVQE